MQMAFVQQCVRVDDGSKLFQHLLKIKELYLTILIGMFHATITLNIGIDGVKAGRKQLNHRFQYFMILRSTMEF